MRGASLRNPIDCIGERGDISPCGEPRIVAEYKVDGEDKEFARRANRTMTAALHETARRGQVAAYFEFATHRSMHGPCSVVACF
jgi:hypothetical protein